MYNIYSWFCLIVWLYLFVYTQIMYFFEIRDLTDLANSLYFFLIQIVLVPKLHYLKKNGDRIRKCIDQLKSELFISQNVEEDEWVSIENIILFNNIFISDLSITRFFVPFCFIVWKSQCAIRALSFGQLPFLSRAVEKLN